MDYTESICFSAAQAEALNKKAFSVNRSLFLFAYYNPKVCCENDSNRCKFQTAIINLYGLFWDCGPFVFQLLFSRDSILLSDWSQVRSKANSLKTCISAFRSIYCHNNSDQFPLNEEKILDAERWATSHCRDLQDIHHISEERWGNLLEHLIKQADSLISDLDSALDKLMNTGDILRKENVVEKWIQLIAKEYRKKPDYLLNTMAGLYQLYLLNSNFERDTGRDLRYLTISWLCSIGNTQPSDWYAPWLYAGESEDSDSNEITNSRIYAILKNWPNEWAERNDCDADECDEPPMPASIFFRILAHDVDQYAQNPGIYPG